MIKIIIRLFILLVILSASALYASAQTYKLAPMSPGNVFVSPGAEPQDISLKVTNWGNDAVLSFAYTLYYTDSQVSANEETYDLETPLEGGETATIQIPILPGTTLGQADIIFTITKVNGAFNETSVPYAYITRFTVRTMPVKRVLVEEWTGMWCQYCPQGLVVMQVLERLYGDRFIGVAVHDGDALATLAYNGMKSTYGMSFPSVWVGRKNKTIDLTDQSVFENELNVTPLANIDVTAHWDAERDNISVTSSVESVININSRYAVAYVLTADGLQHNKFSQKNNYDWIGMENLPPEAEPFVSGEDVSGLSYDDVAIASFGIKNGVEGSLSSPLEANVPQTHTAMFEHISQYRIVSNFSTARDLSNLKVVAILINTETNEVVNAAQCSIDEETTGIESVRHAGTQTGYVYDLSGRRIANANKPGVYLQNGKKFIKK